MMIGYLIAILVVFLDQASKLLVEANISKYEVINIIDNLFYFTKAYNTGAAFSSFASSTFMLVLISVIACVICAHVMYKSACFKTKKTYTISLAFILGGSFGNLIDRFLTSIDKYEGVIDFIGVYLGSYKFPVFNLADSFLVIGVILLCIDITFLEDKRKIVGEQND